MASTQGQHDVVPQNGSGWQLWGPKKDCDKEEIDYNSPTWTSSADAGYQQLWMFPNSENKTGIGRQSGQRQSGKRVGVKWDERERADLAETKLEFEQTTNHVTCLHNLAEWPWAQILEGSVVFQQQLEVTLIQWILHMLLKLWTTGHILSQPPLRINQFDPGPIERLAVYICMSHFLNILQPFSLPNYIHA